MYIASDNCNQLHRQTNCDRTQNTSLREEIKSKLNISLSQVTTMPHHHLQCQELEKGAWHCFKTTPVVALNAQNIHTMDKPATKEEKLETGKDILT